LPGVGKLPSLVIQAGPPPWNREQAQATLQTWLDGDGRLVARGGRSGDLWFMDWPGLGMYVFGSAGDVEAFPLPGVDPDSVRDIYVRGVLPNVMLGRGLECMHASAVVLDGRVVAFSGRSGVGKSTLALALAASGLEHWADDTLLLADTPEGPFTLSLPFPARVDDEAKAAIGFRASEYRQAAPETTAPLARIYLPTRDATLGHAEMAATKLDPLVAFKRVLPYVHPFELAGMARHRRMIESWLSFVRKVPIWELRFSPSLDGIRDLARHVARHAATA
jgi:hypothetical protein